MITPLPSEEDRSLESLGFAVNMVGPVVRMVSVVSASGLIRSISRRLALIGFAAAQAEGRLKLVLAFCTNLLISCALNTNKCASFVRVSALVTAAIAEPSFRAVPVVPSARVPAEIVVLGVSR